MSRSSVALVLVVAGALAAACTSGAAPEPTGSGGPPAAASATGGVVLVYLVDASSDGCDATRAVERSVGSVSPEAALRALLAGPTAAEMAMGYSSWFSSATADLLHELSIDDGVARVAFGDLRPVIPSASSSCGSAALLSALDATLLRFPEIRATRYSILHDEAAFYEWLQRGVPAG